MHNCIVPLRSRSLQCLQRHHLERIHSVTVPFTQVSPLRVCGVMWRMNGGYRYSGREMPLELCHLTLSSLPAGTPTTVLRSTATRHPTGQSPLLPSMSMPAFTSTCWRRSTAVHIHTEPFESSVVLSPSASVRCLETITPRSIRDAATLRVVLRGYTPREFRADLYRRGVPGEWPVQSNSV
ncbi:hypothetical protein C8Q73DRAFT_88000 [Cubamyces lactineus]|nr:hypothetical protein C8Q73DRAFT_88000 [Cubamyces lactineus]